MPSDSFFTIGHSHNICQDYVINGDNYIILSDGCSSAPYSDIGARLLVRCAKKFLNLPMAEIPSNAALNASEIADKLDLSIDSIAATLLIATKSIDNFQTMLLGDGVIAGKRKDGSVLIEIYESLHSAPYYPKYMIEKETNEMYIDQYGTIRKKTTWLVNGKNNLLSEEIQDCTEPAISLFPLEEYEYVALFSDGVLSFTKIVTTNTSRVSEKVDEKDAVLELLNFKNMTGEFVKRRFKRAMKMFQENNWQHFDDVSMGVLR